MKIPAALLLCGFLAGLAVPPPTVADEGYYREADPSLGEAVNRVRGRGREVMSARTLDQDGRRVHVIRALTPEGRMRRFEVEAGRDEPYPRGER